MDRHNEFKAKVEIVAESCLFGELSLEDEGGAVVGEGGGVGGR